MRIVGWEAWDSLDDDDSDNVESPDSDMNNECSAESVEMSSKGDDCVWRACASDDGLNWETISWTLSSVASR